MFVATIYITEVKEVFEAGGLSREQFDALAVAINMGTNIPSVATPNGQAAFLFLLTSALALPYTVVMTLTGFLALVFLAELAP